MEKETKEILYKIIHVLKRLNNGICDEWNERELDRIKNEVTSLLKV